MPRKPRRSISPSVSIARFSREIPRTAHCATYPTIMQALSAANRCSSIRPVRKVREATRHPFSADYEVLDLRTAPRLALPGRGDSPVCLAFCGVPPDAVDQGKQVVDIDAVDNVRFDGLSLGNHDSLLWVV